MNIDKKKIVRAELDVMEVFLKYDIQYIESVYIAMNIISMVCISSGFPFEKFKEMTLQQLQTYEQNWPIG